MTRWACGGQQHLAALVGSLVEVGEWGSLRQPNDVNLWNQTMRVPGGWVVEVPGLPGPDQFARRVQLLNPAPFTIDRDQSSNHEDGRGAFYLAADVIPTAAEAARVMWSWLKARCPRGTNSASSTRRLGSECVCEVWPSVAGIS